MGARIEEAEAEGKKGGLFGLLGNNKKKSAEAAAAEGGADGAGGEEKWHKRATLFGPGHK